MDRICNEALLRKVTTPRAAAAHIKNGMTVGFSGFTVIGYPKVLPVELARRAEEGEDALRANLERSAKSYMDLAQLQYINGVINYLDVLDAQRGYFDAQIGLSNAIRDELITVVQLYKALGGGWKQ